MKKNNISIQEKFLNSIKRGTGEAYLLLIQNQDIDFSTEILEGARINFAYDAQCEGSRGKYIYGLINFCKHKEKLILQILNEFEVIENETYGLSQLYDILCLLAKDKNRLAQEAIVNRFNKDSNDDYWEGESSILTIFGINGLKLIIEKKGKFFKESGNDYCDYSLDYLIDNFQESNLEIDVIKELEKFGEKNEHINVYLEKYRANKMNKNQTKRDKLLDYVQLSEKIKSGKYFYKDKKSISESDILKIADDFIAEQDTEMRINYLDFFGDIEFPYAYNYILNILQHEDLDNRLIDNAIDALSFFKGTDIRQYVMKKLELKKESEVYSKLLINNYEYGDAQILSKAIRKIRNQDKLHSFLCTYIDIYRKNQTKDCQEPLEILYNKTTCALHRVDIIEILRDNDVLSDRIKEEIQYDCDDDIRQIYKELNLSKSM